MWASVRLFPGHLNTILERNQQRPHPVPREIILRLAGKADPPDLTEAHQVEWIETSSG